jgi:hypothetical protein
MCTILNGEVPLLNILEGNHQLAKQPSELKKNCEQYKCLVKLVMAALEKLKTQELQYFDPLVGENACEIRAVMFADLAQNASIAQNITTHLLELKNKIEKLEAFTKVIPLQKMSFAKMLENQGCEVTLPKIFVAATLAHVLTVTKVSRIEFVLNKSESCLEMRVREKTKFNLTIPGENVEEAFAKKIDKTARKILSQYSVEYVQAVAKELPLNEKIEDQRKCIATAHQDGNGRLTIPCFAYMDLLLRHSLLRRIPILLKVSSVDPQSLKPGKAISFFYEVKNAAYELSNEATLINFPQQAIIVIEGFSMGAEYLDNQTLKQKLQAIPLKEIVLCNEAAHPQYAGDKHDTERPSNKRCEKYKEIAQKKGLCKKNALLCYMDHVHVDTLARQLKQMEAAAC